MILDDSIDLTTDKKFGGELGNPLYVSPSKKTYKKYFGKPIEYSKLFHFLVKRSSLLPWNKKMSSYRQRPIRSYGDSISDDFGATIRMTEDNTIMVLGREKNMVYDYLFECFGYEHYSSVIRCLTCGKAKITSYKNKISLYACKNHFFEELPWHRTE